MLLYENTGGVTACSNLCYDCVLATSTAGLALPATLSGERPVAGVPAGAPAPRRSSGAPPVREGPVTPSREGWLTSRTWKGQDRAGEQRAAHRRLPADMRPGVRSAAQRVAGGAPQPDRLRRPGRSSSRRLRCCRKVAPPLLHDRPLRLRPDGAPPPAATMTAAAAPAVGKKDLACCRREPTARAEEHSPEAACVTCSCRSRRWATSYGK